MVLAVVAPPVWMLPQIEHAPLSHAQLSLALLSLSQLSSNSFTLLSRSKMLMLLVSSVSLPICMVGTFLAAMNRTMLYSLIFLSTNSSNLRNCCTVCQVLTLLSSPIVVLRQSCHDTDVFPFQNNLEIKVPHNGLRMRAVSVSHCGTPPFPVALCLHYCHDMVEWFFAPTSSC